VGDDGPEAMPAELPPASTYTYAVELSVDEADEAGAVRVRFDPPAVSYNENFVGFPVGEVVPAGTYDRGKGIWVAGPNGKIVAIVGVADGKAQLDLAGQGVPASETELTALGITDAERTTLAEMYPVDTELWRVAVPHFSAWDYNWGSSPPNGAQSPQGNGDDNSPDGGSCQQSGSIIECHNQTLGQRLSVVGTPFTLNYRSHRVPGYTAGNRIDYRVGNQTFPASALGFRLELQVQSRKITTSLPTVTPGQHIPITWDGLDSYGRKLQGPVSASLCALLDYPAVYNQMGDAGGQGISSSVFGYFGNGASIEGQRGGATLSFRRCFSSLSVGGANGTILADAFGKGDGFLLGIFDAKRSAASLGGWTLSVHHTYAPDVGMLFLGNGEMRHGQQGSRVIDTVAGTGSPFGALGDGGPAKKASLPSPRGMAFGPDGSMYVTAGDRIRKIDRNGIIQTFAGTNLTGFTGDGGPATNARLNGPMDVAVGRDGSVYIADTFNARIRKVGPNGIIQTVAGNGGGFGSTDDQPATTVGIASPRAIAIGPEGDLYILSTSGQTSFRLFRLTSEGRLRKLSGGTPANQDTGDGTHVTKMFLADAQDFGVDGDGSIYISAGSSGSPHLVRKVSSAGVVTRFAGGGSAPDNLGDGGLARDAVLGVPVGITVARDGTVYILTGDGTQHHRLRYVDPSGIIRTLAGQGSVPGVGESHGDTGPAQLAKFTNLSNSGGIAVGPEGGVYIAENSANRIRRVSNSLPGTPSAGDIGIPSPDGSEFYIFDADGRHLRTLGLPNNHVIWSFGYDAAGRLVTVTDTYGAITRIARANDGTPLQIISPDNIITELGLDASGYLDTVTNAEGEANTFTYTALGLMESMTDPKNQTHIFEYDTDGRLTLDRDPEDGFKSLSRITSESSYEVTLTTALGRAWRYFVRRGADGATHRENTAPDGMTIIVDAGSDDRSQLRSPDGSSVAATRSPDPRFGMQSAVSTSTTQMPSGLTRTVQHFRSVVLSNPADKLSVQTLTDTVRLNGRTSTRQFDRVTRTWTSTSPGGRIAKITLDANGRISTLKWGNLEPFGFTYDARGRLIATSHGTSPNVRTTTGTYGIDGFLASVTDTEHRVTVWQRDSVGRVRSQQLPDGRMVIFTYDDNGDVTSITPPGRPAHGFVYDAVDQVTQYAPPDIGLPMQTTQYVYDEDHRLVEIHRPDGRVVSLQYDSTGRIETIHQTRGDTSFGRDMSTGQLRTVDDPQGGRITYTWDGRTLTNEGYSGPSFAGSVGHSYDADFRHTAQSVNGGNGVSLTYDADSLLTQVGAENITRDPSTGFVSATAVGTVTSASAYSGFGEPANIWYAVSGNTVFAQAYTRDALGRIVEKQETVDGVTTVFEYVYDTAGRLIEVIEDGVTTAQYSYDANSNLISEATPTSTVAATYDAQDRLLTYDANTHTYTANGELASKDDGVGGLTQYDYDEMGNLLSVELPDGRLIEYVVDGRNRRVGKKVDAALVQGFLYGDQLDPVAELDSSGDVVARFVYGTMPHSPDYLVKGSATYRLITDGLGSIRFVVEASTGTIVQELEYDAWGRILRDTNPGFQPFGFAGGIYDRDTDLVRFGTRDYDPEVWTIKDPIGFSGGLNHFGYVVGDPVNLVDVDGTQPAPIPVPEIPPPANDPFYPPSPSGGRGAGFGGLLAACAVNPLACAGFGFGLGLCYGLGWCGPSPEPEPDGGMCPAPSADNPPPPPSHPPRQCHGTPSGTKCLYICDDGYTFFVDNPGTDSDGIPICPSIPMPI